MNVLFLALGGTRRPAVVGDAELVLADGGAVTVLVGKPARWVNDPLPEGAEMVELHRLVRDYRPAAVRLLLYRGPLFLLRIFLPGPLRGLRKRLQGAYRRRIARPADRLLARRYRRDPDRVRQRAIVRDLVRGRSVDLVVVGDAESIVTASELWDEIERSGARLAYNVVQEPTPAGRIGG